MGALGGGGGGPYGAGASGAGIEVDGDELAEMLIDRGVPYYLLPHLNRYLVRMLFNHPRDPKTREIRIRPKRQRPAPSFRDAFAARWRGMGLAEHRIDMLMALRTGAGNG